MTIDVEVVMRGFFWKNSMLKGLFVLLFLFSSVVVAHAADALSVPFSSFDSFLTILEEVEGHGFSRIPREDQESIAQFFYHAASHGKALLSCSSLAGVGGAGGSLPPPCLEKAGFWRSAGHFVKKNKIAIMVGAVFVSVLAWQYSSAEMVALACKELCVWATPLFEPLVQSLYQDLGKELSSRANHWQGRLKRDVFRLVHELLWQAFPDKVAIHAYLDKWFNIGFFPFSWRHEKGREYCLRAELALKRGSPKKALKHISNAMKRDPSNASLYLFKAQAHIQAGYLAEGLADFCLYCDQTWSDRRLGGAFAEGFVRGIRDSIGGTQSVYAFSPLLTANQLYEPIERLILAIKEPETRALMGAWLPQEVYQFLLASGDLSLEEKGKQLGSLLVRFGFENFLGDYLEELLLPEVVDCAVALQMAKKIFFIEIAGAVSRVDKQNLKGVFFIDDIDNTFIANNCAKTVDFARQMRYQEGSLSALQGRATLTHPSPELLLSRFSGVGEPLNSAGLAHRGYEELIDFEESIGLYAPSLWGELAPTHMGKICYTKKGAYIVPVAPSW